MMTTLSPKIRLAIIILGCAFSISTHAEGFKLWSPAFKKDIPPVYSCNGDNVSPPLHWANPPPNTQAFALIMKSPNAVFVPVFYNWVLYNIPPTATELKRGANRQDFTDGTLIGANSFNETGYAPPCPPDSAMHHYIFSLYALDAELDLTPGADIRDVMTAVSEHTIAQSDYEGQFSH